jgi:hypothetical protein
MDGQSGRTSGEIRDEASEPSPAGVGARRPAMAAGSGRQDPVDARERGHVRLRRRRQLAKNALSRTVAAGLRLLGTIRRAS